MYGIKHGIKHNVLFILIFVILQGCAVTNIPLKEVSYTSPDIPMVQWKSVILVVLSDTRGIDSIGFTNDGAEILAKGNVAMWATKNLAAILQKAGYRVSIASSIEEARGEKSSYIVMGNIDSLHLEIGSFSSTATVKVTIKTTNTTTSRKAENTFSASRSAVNNPFGDTEAEVLLEALLQAYASVPSLLN